MTLYNRAPAERRRNPLSYRTMHRLNGAGVLKLHKSAPAEWRRNPLLNRAPAEWRRDPLLNRAPAEWRRDPLLNRAPAEWRRDPGAHDAGQRDDGAVRRTDALAGHAGAQLCEGHRPAERPDLSARALQETRNHDRTRYEIETNIVKQEIFACILISRNSLIL